MEQETTTTTTTPNNDQPLAVQFTVRDLIEAVKPHHVTATSRVSAPPYNTSQDMREYLTLFELVAHNNRWDPAEAGIQLRCSLAGPALRIANTVPDLHYPELRDVLLERLTITARDARFQMRHLIKEKGATTHDLADKIRKLMRIGHGTECRDQRYLAQLETELFLETLDWTEVSMHAEMAGATTLEEAISVAKRLEGIQERSRAGKTARLRALNLDDPDSEESAMIRQLHASKLRDQSPKDPCYECGGPHYPAQCSTRQVSRSGSRRSGNE